MRSRYLATEEVAAGSADRPRIWPDNRMPVGGGADAIGPSPFPLAEVDITAVFDEDTPVGRFDILLADDPRRGAGEAGEKGAGARVESDKELLGHGHGAYVGPRISRLAHSASPDLAMKPGIMSSRRVMKRPAALPTVTDSASTKSDLL